MPVDKFARMSDTKTTDSGVSLTYINNNYVRSDGGTPLTGSLDMKGNIIYNVAEPVNPQDVVTKVYVDNTKGSGVIGRKIGDAVSIKENMDFMGKQKIKNLPDPVNDHDAATKEYVDTKTELGDIDMGGQFTVLNVKTPINDNHITDKKYVDEIVENLTLKQGLIRENGGFNLVDSYINMNFNNIRNVGYPKHTEDAVPRSFVDDMVKEVEEKIEKRKQLIAVHARYCGDFKDGEYQFKFSGANFENCEEILGKYEDFKGSITGFVMPHSGHIKKIICEGLVFRSLDNITDFIFNFITDHKKELKLSDVDYFLEKATYLDIEDV